MPASSSSVGTMSSPLLDSVPAPASGTAMRMRRSSVAAAQPRRARPAPASPASSARRCAIN
ncbi:hypothetical protein [Xylophilus sp.]|uniref:hypothetical protein n=1 Tax=Xylophilus sp. TaxID=2653893 RepID=UPI002D7F52AF|nr:hypothetical protein [Xylophilus sp.]